MASPPSSTAVAAMLREVKIQPQPQVSLAGGSIATRQKQVWSPPTAIYFDSLMRHSPTFRAMIDRLVSHVRRGQPTNAK